MNLQPGQKVLEAGCGLGKHAQLIAQAANDRAEVIAIDKSDRLLMLARENADTPKLIYQQADVESLPFEDQCQLTDIHGYLKEKYLVDFSDAKYDSQNNVLIKSISCFVRSL